MTIVNILSALISTSITLYCIIRFFNGTLGNEKPLYLNDQMQLGYIDLNDKVSKLESNTHCSILPFKEIDELKEKVKLLKHKIKEKDLKKQIEILQYKLEKQDHKIPETKNKLIDDCVSALIALGTKKKTAKEEVNRYFAKHNAKNVEEFINNFFKDRHDKSHCSD